MLERAPSLLKFGGGAFSEGSHVPQQSVEQAGVDVKCLFGLASWAADGDADADARAGAVLVRWDGSRVPVVDFEDSGLSDRAFDLAEITEHVASWVDRPLDVVSFLDRFDLTAAERARLGECRRLLALVWLFLLALDDAEHPRNPPGIVERQADRLAELLG